LPATRPEPASGISSGRPARDLFNGPDGRVEPERVAASGGGAWRRSAVGDPRRRDYDCVGRFRRLLGDDLRRHAHPLAIRRWCRQNFITSRSLTRILSVGQFARTL